MTVAREEALFYQRGDLTGACLGANRIDSVNRNRGTEGVGLHHESGSICFDKSRNVHTF